MSNFKPETPYNTIPMLPPKFDLETPLILKACIEANKELAKLKMAERLIPNQTVLINTIPLLESQASSAIENIVTTTDDLFKYADSQSTTISPEIKETLRYRTALYQGLILIKQRPLNISTVCEVCSIIHGVEFDVRKLPGTTLINDLTREKIYTPPEGEELLRKLLTNWQNYLHLDDQIDPLIKLAVQHYQFEAIHPFTDGNGRTGRIINLLYLIDQNLLDTPILYLSRYIIQNKSNYYSNLLRVTTHEAWSEWVLYFMEAIRETAIWTTNKIISIHKLINDTCSYVQQQAPLIYNKDLVELLFIQPYIRIGNIVEHNHIGRFTASKHLKILCDIDVLEEIKVGREKIFINKKFLNLLKRN
ncbi:MAG: Fic family protein [Parachlamydiaceae bacterium]|nr:Fic family protein [Parachlamydiaceae bacterium]